MKKKNKTKKQEEMTVNLFCFVKLQIFVWTYIPNYLSIDSDCEIPEARPDADTVQPI